MGRYFTLGGPIETERYLYCELGRRGAPTLNPIAPRIGAVGDGWLPAMAAAMTNYVQARTSREAVECVAGTGRLPYCRSSSERVTNEVELY